MAERSKEGKIGYYSETDFGPNDILYMLKDLPDACCVFKVMTDPFGTVKDMLFLFANERYAQLVGKPSAELIGSTYYEVVTNRDEDWIKFSYQAAILRQSTIMRTYNTTYDKWFEFWAVPVYQKGFCAFIIHDVTAAKHSEDDIALNTNTNSLVIECATALSSAEFGKGIKKVLKLLGQELGADRAYIIEIDEDNRLKDIHEWVSAASISMLPSKKDFEANDFITMWNKQLKNTNIVVVNDTTAIQKVNEDVYDNVLAGNIQRYALSALNDKKERLGFLVIDNYDGDLVLDVASAVETVGIFISYELRNRKLTHEMMYLGSHDALTGIGNRYSLNQSLLILSEMSVPVGVCYADINGLKLINDEKGHEEGDNIIKAIATTFASTFKKKYCYRIGGDEFIAIIPDIEESKFNDLVEKFRLKNKKANVAIGSVWSNDSKDIKTAVRNADQNMYDDKSKYYANHERRHSVK